jgi:hypothetical protein
MSAMISFESAPPFAAPLRFFLTAPLFAMLAGVLITIEGPAIFASRWMPATLALTHLLTVGFMLQIMLGALIQILPVVAGANLSRPLLVAAVVHSGLTAGTLLLAGGLYYSAPMLLSSSVVFLGLSVGFFLFSAVRALVGIPSSSPTIRGLKLALFGLSVVVGLGIVMVFAIAHGWSLPLQVLTNLHAGWGFGGWAGILLAAIAYVVVPMFQLTPGYPARASWWYPVVMLGLMVLWTLAVVADWSVGERIAQAAAGLLGLAFAGLTLRLQQKRRRARSDVTYRYWQLGLWASIFALFMLCTVALWPAASDLPGWSLIFGILLIVGGFLPFIIGMLYRIVPFLAWMHLQSVGQYKVPAPNMNQILPGRHMEWQMFCYTGAVLLLLLAAVFPELIGRFAGAAFTMACGWLWLNLFRAIRRYQRHKNEIEGKLQAKAVGA